MADGLTGQVAANRWLECSGVCGARSTLWRAIERFRGCDAGMALAAVGTGAAVGLAGHGLGAAMRLNRRAHGVRSAVGDPDSHQEDQERHGGDCGDDGHARDEERPGDGLAALAVGVNGP